MAWAIFEELGLILGEGASSLLPNFEILNQRRAVVNTVLKEFRAEKPMFQRVEALAGKRYKEYRLAKTHFYVTVQEPVIDDKANRAVVAAVIYCYPETTNRVPSYEDERWVAVAAVLLTYKLPKAKGKGERQPDPVSRPSVSLDKTIESQIGRRLSAAERSALKSRRGKGIDVWKHGFNPRLTDPNTPRHKVGGRGGSSHFNPDFRSTKNGGRPREKWKPLEPTPGPAKRAARAAGRKAIEGLFNTRKR